MNLFVEHDIRMVDMYHLFISGLQQSAFNVCDISKIFHFNGVHKYLP